MNFQQQLLIDQPTERPTDQPTDRPTNWSINQPIDQPTNRPTNRPTADGMTDINKLSPWSHELTKLAILSILKSRFEQINTKMK